MGEPGWTAVCHGGLAGISARNPVAARFAPSAGKSVAKDVVANVFGFCLT